MLKTNEAALVCGLAESTLEKRRLYGGGPKFVKFGRAVRYRMEDLIEFAKDNIFSSTSEYGRAMVH